MIATSLSGHPSFFRICQSASLLTVSNAFVRSMNAAYKLWFCSMYFSCSCQAVNIMSTVLHALRKSHWDSETSSRKCSTMRFWIIFANTFPAVESKEIPRWFPHSDRLPLFLKIVMIAASLKC